MALTLVLVESGVLLSAVLLGSLAWGHPVRGDGAAVATLLAQVTAIGGCCLVAFYYNDFYDLRIVKSFAAFATRLLPSFGMAFLLLAALYATFPDVRLPDGPFVASVAVIVGLLLPVRAASYAVMRSAPFQERVLILGASPLALKVIREIEAQPHVRYRVVAIADDPSPGGDTWPYPLRGPLEHLDKIIEEIHPDRIIVALRERRGRLPVRQLLDAQRNGIVAEDGVQVYERLSGKVAIESLTPSQLIFSPDFQKSRVELAASRAISLAVAAVALIVFAPLMALIALAVKLDTAGPVFFVQARVGAHGRSFRLIKFRTMRPAVGPHSEWARDNTARLTRVGRWLRKFRLDELPQLINVLRGELNLVGPRPHPVSNFEYFMEHIPYYSVRAGARPGVTGWAQIRYGYANNLAEETEKMRYDLYYIKHLSPWLDLRILFDTVKIIVFGRGAE